MSLPTNNHSVSFVISLLLHGVLLGLFTLNIGSEPERPRAAANPAPIQATAVAAQVVDEQLDLLRQEVQKQRDAERHRREEKKRVELEARRRAEEKKRAEAEAKRLAERKKAQAEARKLAEAKKKAEEEARKKAEAEAKAAEKKQQEAAAREKAEAERLAREEEQRRIDEMRAKMEAEELERQAAEAARKAEADQQAQVLRSREQERELAIYKRDISNRIESGWIKPPGIDVGFECEVVVFQARSGDVTSVNVTDCERVGGRLLARSVEAAVRKASPLPLPVDAELFDPELALIIKPDR